MTTCVSFFCLLCLSFIPRYPSSSLSSRRSPCCRLHTDRLPSFPTPRKRAPRHLSPHPTSCTSCSTLRQSDPPSGPHLCRTRNILYIYIDLYFKPTCLAASKAEELDESVLSFPLSPAPLSRSWAFGNVLPVFSLTPSRIFGSLGTRPWFYSFVLSSFIELTCGLTVIATSDLV